MWVLEYLRLLNVEQKQPSLPFLKKLMKRHRLVFPFENVSKLLIDQYEKKPIITVDEFLDRRKNYDMGGTCYTLNIQFARLLRELGYVVSYIRPGNEHLALLVGLADSKKVWYVDVGTTAPILAPLPLGIERQTPIFAGEKVHLRKGEEPHTFTYVRTIGGRQVSKKWAFRSDQRYTIDDLVQPIQQSFLENGPYMSCIRIDKWCEHKQRMLSLKNTVLTMRGGGSKTERSIKSLEEMKAVLQDTFHLPKLPVLEAVEQLEARGHFLIQKSANIQS
ncbi:LOW QUALITY PROTEIN: hypothetical protein JCM19055_4809 [Geomicrobium sp. JCM 19055]|nr:LOW QUALITY PROTEIN: hypothetical protein JCM19055_4809 [Geomicrobium sp. JCM 19055]